jgi:isocitrate dehydrogenase
MDIVIGRRNEEDLYAGIELLTNGQKPVQCLKLISRLVVKNCTLFRLKVYGDRKKKIDLLYEEGQHHEAN